MVPPPPASDPPGPPSADPIVLLSDTTDEGERLGAALRTRGYSVVDVPVAGLASRARAVMPSLVLCDLDVAAAAPALAALLDLGLTPPPRVILFSDRGPAAMATHPAVERLGAELFPRPVDVFGVLRRVEALVGAPSKLPGGSLMPPGSRSVKPNPGSDPGLGSAGSMRPLASRPSGSAPGSRASEIPGASLPAPSLPAPSLPAPHLPAPSLPAPSVAPPAPAKAAPLEAGPEPALPAAVPLLGATDGMAEDPALGTGSVASPEDLALPLRPGADPEAESPFGHLPQSPMSAELQRLLASAEQRIRHARTGSSRPPARLSPEAELEAVLPAEVLEALDEPLDDEAESPASEPDSDRARPSKDDSDPGWTEDEAESTRGGAPLSAARRTPGSTRDADDGQPGTAAEVPGRSAELEETPLPRPRPVPPVAERGARTAAEAPEAPAASGAAPAPGANPPQLSPKGRDDADGLATAPPARPQRPAEPARPRGEAARRVSPPSHSSPTAALDPSTNPPPRVGGEPEHVTHRPGSAPPRSDQPRGPASQRPTNEPPSARTPRQAPEARRAASPLPERPNQPARVSPIPPSDAPRRPTPPGPARARPLPESSPRSSSIPPLRGDPLSLARPGARPVLPGSVARPASGPPPSMPSNAFIAGAVESPHLSSGPPIVQAMPIPAQELLDEPFAAASDPRALAPRAAPSVTIPTSLQEGDAVRALAILVRTRYTGAVAFETAQGIQRAVLRDGDFVTAASGLETESLTAFLVQRGVLTATAAMSLARRIPGFGRHAGAALIAHGHLRQDELWPVLRAHAEWILGRMMMVDRGAASLEPEVPVRLKSEPAVFGGATGAEGLGEIARRVVPAELAVRRLGGPNARFGDGGAPALLGECALPDHEQLHVNRARSAPLHEVLASAKAPDFAAVLYALVELGVLDRRPSGAPQPVPTAPPAPRAATPPPAVAPTAPPAVAAAPPAVTPAPPRKVELDDAARRERIVARLSLVREGDYFALLDLPRDASAFDVRRGYEELRAEFEPERLLTAKTADLKDDVALILEVLEEACEILSDDARRTRYRRAIETVP